MRDLTGATVVRCLTDVFVAPGEVGDPRNPYRVSLLLDDGSVATIQGDHKDFESITITDQVPEAADMGELGRVEVLDSGPVCDAFAGGTVITSAVPVVNSNGITFGLRIDTSAGVRLYVVYWGDELYVLDELWPGIAAEVASPEL